MLAFVASVVTNCHRSLHRASPSGTSVTLTSSSKPMRSGGETTSRTSPERWRAKPQRKSWNIPVRRKNMYLFFYFFFFSNRRNVSESTSYIASGHYSQVYDRDLAYYDLNVCMCVHTQLCSGSAATSCRTLRRSWLRSREERPASRGGSASRKHWTQR